MFSGFFFGRSRYSSLFAVAFNCCTQRKNSFYYTTYPSASGGSPRFARPTPPPPLVALVALNTGADVVIGE